MSDRNELGVLSALVLGGLIGAAAGLLLAPEKGTKTRARIRKWAETEWDDRKEYLEELRDEIEEKIAEKKSKITGKIEQFKEDFADAVMEEEEKLTPHKKAK